MGERGGGKLRPYLKNMSQGRSSGSMPLPRRNLSLPRSDGARPAPSGRRSRCDGSVPAGRRALRACRDRPPQRRGRVPCHSGAFPGPTGVAAGDAGRPLVGPETVPSRRGRPTKAPGQRPFQWEPPRIRRRWSTVRRGDPGRTSARSRPFRIGPRRLWGGSRFHGDVLRAGGGPS